MAHVWVDRQDDGTIRVAWQSGAQPTKERVFADRVDAERFAYSKLGKRTGMICSTLDMTLEQWEAEKERRRVTAERIKNLGL